MPTVRYFTSLSITLLVVLLFLPMDYIVWLRSQTNYIESFIVQSANLQLGIFDALETRASRLHAQEALSEGSAGNKFLIVNVPEQVAIRSAVRVTPTAWLVPTQVGLDRIEFNIIAPSVNWNNSIRAYLRTSTGGTKRVVSLKKILAANSTVSGYFTPVNAKS
jgi:hypothetical protein